MKTRTIAVAALLCLAGAMCFAENANMGTWKLNEAKSKFAAGATKNSMVVYEAMGENVKVSVDGMSSDGKALHSEWTGKFDGKDYAVTGDPGSDMRSYKMVNDHTMMLTGKKDGKMVTTGKIVVSADGKSRTVTINSRDDKGNKMTNMAMYDKQ